MMISRALALLLVTCADLITGSTAFCPHLRHKIARFSAPATGNDEKLTLSRWASADDVRSEVGVATSDEETQPGATLALLTFDLDDTLFPISPVVEDANVAMVEAMENLGYRGATQDGVLKATRKIRTELAERDEAITYTDLRKRAVRAELERDISIESGANFEVHSSVVEHVFDAWLDARQKSAGRRLFPGALEMLSAVKSQYPGLVIGAITNGRGDPLDMPALAPYFDFCVSGEDEGVFPLRKPHRGIYDAALQRYAELETGSPIDGIGDAVWVHVGDDLANDVGASAASGAYAIWFDMTDEGGEMDGARPIWSTATPEEVERRKRLADKAKDSVSARVMNLAELPDAIDTILRSCNS